MTTKDHPLTVASGTAFGDIKIIAAPTGQRLTVVQSSHPNGRHGVETISLHPVQAPALAAALLGANDPDGEVTNRDRAHWAGLSLRLFAAVVGEEGEEPETVLGDLLANLMHYASDYGIDFSDALEQGRDHFEEEVEIAQFAAGQ